MSDFMFETVCLSSVVGSRLKRLKRGNKQNTGLDP